MKKEEILNLINKKYWYHKYEILPGIVTPGRLEVNPENTLNSLGISNDLTGKKIFDIGAWDGAYTFEFERRGAMVTALDIHDPDHTGFNISQKIKKSHATYICSSVYELSPDLKNEFDIVFFKGVYYHLKDPLLSFKRIRDVLKQDGVIYFEGAILDFADNVDKFWKDKNKDLSKLSSLPVTYFAKDEYGQFNDPSCWFIPTKRCLHDWLIATGYKRIEIQTYEKISRAYGSAIKDENFKDFEHWKM